MPIRNLRLAHALVALLICASAAAQEEPASKPEVDLTDQSWRRPLRSRNQAPLALLFIYMAPDRASAIPSRETDLDIALDYSNIIQEQRTETDFVRFDLEYLRTLVALKRGFGSDFELGVSVPFYVYYGGFLDPLVSSFHEGLGLPNTLRGQTPYGLVDYQYRRGNDVVLAGQDSFAAIGDVTLDAKKTVLERGLYALAVRGALKLPTGDPQNLSGSGATDLGIGMAVDRIGEQFGFYVNANYHFLGQAERFETRDFFSFMVGADWRLKPRLATILQFDYMRPPLVGELRLLKRSGRQVALGLRFDHSDKFVYEWRLVEDLSKFSPDFTVAFEMGVRFQGGAR